MTSNKKTKRSLLMVVCSGLVFSCLIIVPSLAHGQASESAITLTWVTDTFVPPGYPGKALPAKGSVVEVFATIDLPNLNPAKVSYNWYFNDQIKEESSGLGKQSFKFRVGQSSRQEDTVNLQIKSGDTGAVLAESRRIAFRAVDPEIVIQSRAPILISDNAAFVYQAKSDTETEFIAQPYYFNIKNLGELSYNWTLEGASDKEYKQTILLKVGQVSEVIEKTLRVWIKSMYDQLESASESAILNFIP